LKCICLNELSVWIILKSLSTFINFIENYTKKIKKKKKTYYVAYVIHHHSVEKLYVVYSTWMRFCCGILDWTLLYNYQKHLNSEVALCSHIIDKQNSSSLRTLYFQSLLLLLYHAVHKKTHIFTQKLIKLTNTLRKYPDYKEKEKLVQLITY